MGFCFLIIVLLLCTNFGFASENRQEMFSKATIQREIASFTYSNNYESNTYSSYEAIDNTFGGILSHKTCELSGLSLGEAFTTTNGIGSYDYIVHNL